MALFLAGLRGIDGEIFKAAQIDGANLPTIYRKIVIPSMRPVFFSVLLILCHIAIKTFDLVVALTGGRSGHLVLAAGHLHVHVFVQSRAARRRRGIVDDDARDRRGRARADSMYLESRSTRNAA